MWIRRMFACPHILIIRSDITHTYALEFWRRFLIETDHGFKPRPTRSVLVLRKVQI